MGKSVFEILEVRFYKWSFMILPGFGESTRVAESGTSEGRYVEKSVPRGGQNLGELCAPAPDATPHLSTSIWGRRTPG